MQRNFPAFQEIHFLFNNSRGKSDLKCWSNPGNITWGYTHISSIYYQLSHCHWNTFNPPTHTHTHSWSHNFMYHWVLFCWETWDPYFLTGQWKGGSPQPADNRSLFRGLCFRYTAPLTLQPFFLSWTHRQCFVIMQHLYQQLCLLVHQCPLSSQASNSASYIQDAFQLLIPILEISHIQQRAESSEQWGAGVTPDLHYNCLSSGWNFCAGSTSVTFSLSQHEQFLLSIQILPQKTLSKDI